MKKDKIIKFQREVSSWTEDEIKKRLKEMPFEYDVDVFDCYHYLKLVLSGEILGDKNKSYDVGSIEQTIMFCVLDLVDEYKEYPYGTSRNLLDVL